MGLHAVRNIGFHFKDQKAMCRKWQEKFIDFDPSRAAGILHLSVRGEAVEITYFDQLYRLLCTDGVLEKKTESGWTDDLYVNEALVVYHLFNDLQDYPVVTGKWCPEDTLDPVRARSANRIGPLLEQFTCILSANKDAVTEKALKTGGVKTDQGDWGFEFHPFAFLPVRLAWWEADEDFPAQLMAYVDTHATDFIDYEAVDFVIADLLTHLQPED